MKKVLFFFPHNPYPPQNGSHKRCLQLLDGLRRLGCRIKFASSAYISQPWTRESVNGLVNHFGCEDVSIFQPTFAQKGISAGLDYLKRLYSDVDLTQTLTSRYAKRWFTSISTDFEPDVLFLNYAYTDALVDRTKKCYGNNSIMEMHDLISINNKMQKSLIEAVGVNAIVTGNNIEKILDLKYYDNATFVASKTEYDIYDKYNFITCISEHEKDVVAKNTLLTKAVYLPMTQEVHDHNNSYDADALFCVGPNPFNSQGYYYFIYKVLPFITKQRPDFSMKVTGNFFAYRPPKLIDGITYEGFIDDLAPVFAAARFFVCPVFGGTGQQVKIVEAMAHGLPVVAFRSAAARSPIRHGENGLIADCAEEFAGHVLDLWSNRDLCRKLGIEARQTISREYNQMRLVSNLAPLVTQ